MIFISNIWLKPCPKRLTLPIRREYSLMSIAFVFWIVIVYSLQKKIYAATGEGTHLKGSRQAKKHARRTQDTRFYRMPISLLKNRVSQYGHWNCSLWSIIRLLERQCSLPSECQYMLVWFLRELKCFHERTCSLMVPRVSVASGTILDSTISGSEYFRV